MFIFLQLEFIAIKLINNLNNDNPNARSAAAYALGQMENSDNPIVLAFQKSNGIITTDVISSWTNCNDINLVPACVHAGSRGKPDEGATVAGIVGEQAGESEGGPDAPDQHGTSLA